jgi:carbon starvation protein CstA
MVTFFVCIFLLVAGYFFYGKLIARRLDVDSSRPTPAYTLQDGVDYQPMPTWKVFVIQFLNIAGLGPIFGAILGAAYGPASYIWIVIGCVLMGAVHDFFAGMMSIRNGGANMQELTGKYLGRGMKNVMSFVLVFLLMAVGVSFILGPSDLLSSMTGMSKELWLLIIFAYYILATLLPIDKIIGTVYPYMGAVLLFMALGVGVMLVAGDINGTHEMVELSPANLANWHYSPDSNILFPMLFIVVSCGAISGFHATQSPLMARCLKNEKHARPVFYGAMIAEGIVAMIWATAAMAYFGGPYELSEAMAGGMTPNMAVKEICESWLGKLGAVIAIIGVVFCPITSGDTAFRSLRLSIADMLKIDQKPITKRLWVSIPIFLVAFFFCKVDFSKAWTFLGISNQILATIVLWTGTAYLISKGKKHLMCSLPAAFLTYVCVSYLLVAPHDKAGLHLSPELGNYIGLAVAVILFAFCLIKGRKARGNCEAMQDTSCE